MFINNKIYIYIKNNNKNICERVHEMRCSWIYTARHKKKFMRSLFKSNIDFAKKKKKKNYFSYNSLSFTTKY